MYNIGDKVCIADERCGSISNDGLMDCWLGKIMTVTDIQKTDDGNTSYAMKEDGGVWVWDDAAIKGLLSDNMPEDLRNILVNGAFVINRNGVIGVVVNDVIVYQNGSHVYLERLSFDLECFAPDGTALRHFDVTSVYYNVRGGFRSVNKTITPIWCENDMYYKEC